jgi:hypothetical protein
MEETFELYPCLIIEVLALLFIQANVCAGRQTSHNSSIYVVNVTNIVWDLHALSSTGNVIDIATDVLDFASLLDF